MDEVKFIDVTLRDGSMSVWANRMSIGTMLPMIDDLDAAGFDSAEYHASTMLTCLPRIFNENPWDWIKLGVQRAKRTPLLMHGGMRPAFRWQPRAIQGLYAQLLASYGLTTTRMSNPWNDPDALARQAADLAVYGIRSVVNLIYTVSPRHTLEYYRERAQRIAAHAPYRICIKDVGGLLTPDRTRELVPIVLDAAGDIPVEFHAHANNGLAALNCLAAVEGGIRLVHSAVPPLANGTSHTSIFNLSRNLQSLGYQPAIDLMPLQRVSEHLHRVCEIEHLPVGMPQQYDQGVYEHQIPGGMVAHLASQLGELGLDEHLEAVKREAARVRVDFGYPIMVTPLSQFVGTQAVANVTSKDRYRMVSDEVIRYALGEYGEEAVTVMDPDIRDRILDRPRAKEMQQRQREEPTLDELRQRVGRKVSDEELVTRWYAGESASSAFVDEGQRRYPETYDDYWSARDPLGFVLSGVRGTGRSVSVRIGERQALIRKR